METGRETVALFRNGILVANIVPDRSESPVEPNPGGAPQWGEFHGSAWQAGLAGGTAALFLDTNV